MGEVGSLGKIKFYVRETDGTPKILSFTDMTRESSARYEEHPVNGKKAFMEFVSPQPDQITMTIVAKKELGASPYKVQKQLHDYLNKGTVCTFMVGGRRIGSYKWVITNLSDAYQTVCMNGSVTEMRFTVTLKEYRYKKKKNTDQKEKIKTASVKKSVTKEPVKKSYDTYVIKKGDTLWGLAEKAYGDGTKYTRIYNANKGIIKNPSKLTIGWVIKIPK